jgi:hypothetical protein
MDFKDFQQTIAKRLTRTGFQGFSSLLPNNSIKDGKIWIQWNATDLDIAQKLVHLGISPQDIVIGFHPVNLRQYSDYAVR